MTHLTLSTWLNYREKQRLTPSKSQATRGEGKHEKSTSDTPSTRWLIIFTSTILHALRDSLKILQSLLFWMSNFECLAKQMFIADIRLLSLLIFSLVCSQTFRLFFFYFLFFLFNFGIGFASVSLLNAEKFATFFLLWPFVSVALSRKIYVKCFHSSRYVDFKLCCLITFALPLWTFLLECEFCFIPSFEVFSFRFLLLFMVRALICGRKNWKFRKCHRRHSPLMVSID